MCKEGKRDVPLETNDEVEKKKVIEHSKGVQCIDIWYPKREDPPHVQIGLVHVRAADDIRIRYDFERDGWAILQPRFGVWCNHVDTDPAWTEVAFIQAWSLQKPGPFGEGSIACEECTKTFTDV